MTKTKNILLKSKKFVDGDGLIFQDFIAKKEFEIILYGIDVPEMNYCKKVKNDEKELQMPMSLLIKLGCQSLEFLKTNVNLRDLCTLVQEKNI